MMDTDRRDVPPAFVEPLERLCELAVVALRARSARILVDGRPVAGSRVDPAPGPRFERRVVSGDAVASLEVLGEPAREWTAEDGVVLDALAGAVSAELERSSGDARAEEDRLRLGVALESAGIGSWELDPLSQDFRGDPRTLEMFGFPPDSSETRLSEFSKRVPRPDRRRVNEALQASLTAGTEYAEEYRVLLPDGSLRWVAATGRPLRDATGAFVRLVGSASDTTDRHRSAERAEASSALIALIASASEVLASSLEPEDTVRNLARLVVPTLADWSVVSVVDDEGRLEDVDWWHRDPARQDLTGQFARARLEGREEAEGSLQVFTSREPLLVNHGAQAYAVRTLRSEQALAALLELDLGSVVVFPLLTDAGVLLGLLTLARDTGRAGFDTEEIGAALDLCRRASVGLENARSFGREREMSEQLQRSLLSEPTQPEHVEVVVRYAPATKAAQVGGDWYDSFAQEDGATMLVVGDVIGHDSVAAAVMGQLRSMLRGIAVTETAGPARLLTALDRALDVLRIETTATLVVARVEGETAGGDVRVSWSNAGHPPLVLVAPGGAATVLHAHDLMLGLAPEHPRTDHHVTLRPGSTLLLYTDGLVERRGEDIDQGIERLRSTVGTVMDLPLGRAVDELIVDMLPVEPYDDVVVLAMRVAR